MFLSLVCLLSAVPYLTHLGFYDDDWQFWSDYNSCSDHSLLDLTSCNTDFGILDVRPIWRLYIAAMFRLFGNNPVGCHVVMLAVSTLGILLLYLVLRELHLPRSATFAVPLTYALLPHYSTAKFWIASAAAGLSITLYFLSVYSALRALRTELWNRWCWSVVSISAMLASALSYEVAIPLFTLTPLMLWYNSRPDDVSLHWTATKSRRDAGLVVVAICAAITAAGFKAGLQTRSPLHFRFLNRLDAVAIQAVLEFITFNCGRYGFGMPRTVWRIVRYYPNREIFGLAVLLTVLIFLYLCWILRTAELPTTRTTLALAGAGVIVYWLSYALFAAQRVPMFTTTGPDNRVAIAGALGTAMLDVGTIGWLSLALGRGRLQKYVFCLVVAMVGGSGFLANSTLASFWLSASESQQQILSDIHARFPALPSGTIFLLDGVCTRNGPGPIFGKDYDLAGALRILYGNYTIRANVVTPSTTVEQRYLSVKGEEAEDRYSYQQNMIVYDFKRKASVRLVDVRAARRYFGVNEPRSSDTCTSQMAEPF